MSLSIDDYRETADESEKRGVLRQFPDPRRETRQCLDDDRRHTDAESIRRHHGLSRFEPDSFRYRHLIPNVLTKSWDPPSGHIEGGKDLLARGKPGSGKSTLANHLATIFAARGSTVVWRASPSRSEWLPLAPWSRVCLPAGADIDVELDPQVKTDPFIKLDIDDLEDIVREVRYYENPLDLNHNILTEPMCDRSGALHPDDGTINIVYPDPNMTDCQAIYQRSDAKEEGVEFTADSPLNHWWFAWFIARVDFGPNSFFDWIADEFGQIASNEVEKDEFGSYQLVSVMKSKWIDARKLGLSIYMFVHDEADCHEKIIKKVRWRCQMPTTGNPTSKAGVLGYESVPMDTDMMGRYDEPGTALMYDEGNFEKFNWGDLSTGIPYKLKIRVS